MQNAPKFYIRRATFFDIEFLWYLRNQADVYKYFKKAQPTSWEEHIDWVLPIILDIVPKTLFIIEKSGLPVGQIRVDYKTSDVSISVLKEFRGEIIATKALNLAIKEVKKRKKVKELIAEIHGNNLPSIKLFEKLDFKFKTKKGSWLKYILNL